MAEMYVATKVYTGPLDLLLFLVRRAEVDIHDLPVSEVADQYIAELEKMDRVDLSFAGEYLVLAAQLLKIKSEMVLYAADKKASKDPRQSLVRQLLEYKHLRERSFEMGTLFEDASKRYGRPANQIPLADAEEDFLENVQIFDLYRQYDRLLGEITPAAAHRIELDERPIEEFIKMILQQLLQHGEVDFRTLFAAAPRKSTVIGNFLAVLELVKEQKVDVIQQSDAITLTRKQAPADSNDASGE